MFTYLLTHVHTHTRTHIHAHAYTHIYTRTHTYTHSCTHTHPHHDSFFRKLTYMCALSCDSFYIRTQMPNVHTKPVTYTEYINLIHTHALCTRSYACVYVCMYTCVRIQSMYVSE